jgi:hypothetical protein
MDKFKLEYVYNLLYSEDKESTVKEINSISDGKLLHVMAGNYNWDNGFEIPYSILNNDNCDLGTALMMFYDADGYRILEDEDELNNPNLVQWSNFISKIYEKISENKFKSSTIKFMPPLSKVQIFKLKKSKPNIDTIFLEESAGDFVEIPNI